MNKHYTTTLNHLNEHRDNYLRRPFTAIHQETLENETVNLKEDNKKTRTGTLGFVWCSKTKGNDLQVPLTITYCCSFEMRKLFGQR